MRSEDDPLMKFSKNIQTSGYGTGFEGGTVVARP